MRVRSDSVDNIIYFEHSGDVGIGLNNPTAQLELSQNDATKPVSSFWGITSTKNIKKNIKQNKTKSLDIFKRLKFKEYELDDEFIRHENARRCQPCYSKGRKYCGYIAEDLERIPGVEHCVQTTLRTFKENFIKTVDYHDLMMHSFNAIKELVERLERLEGILVG